MTDDVKKKIFKRPSRKTVVISGAVIVTCAALWLIFGQGIAGDKNIDFKQLSKKDVPKSIETEVIPEYRELERSLGCLIDGKVYVVVTRGEKPTAGYEAAIDKIEIEKTKQGTNMKVHAAFTEPDEDKAVSQVTTYPYVVAETELTSLPRSIELIAKYVQ